MSRGFADAVELYWFDDGIEGRDVGMSEYTFKRGLRELLDKSFCIPRPQPASGSIRPCFSKAIGCCLSRSTVAANLLLKKNLRRMVSNESNLSGWHELSDRTH